MTEKKQVKWQNLAVGKCPFDDMKLERDGKVYACYGCDYYITPAKLVEFLRDPTSKARAHMSHDKQVHIDSILQPAEV